ncbi:DUF4192 family protein [Pseudarthrobacter sp. N5]|uniref:DUF4192 family protein n=1 Tax=Pseudarthrobacter sp. N5 TaxID=3418416 RepID=UPI003CF8A2DB
MVYRGSSVGAPPSFGILPVRPGMADPAIPAWEQRYSTGFHRRKAGRAQFEGVLDTWESVLRPAPAPELAPRLRAYLRASLRVPAWRDAVLVMAAAGRQAAERGAEDFGVFDDDARLAPILPPPGDLAPGPVPRAWPDSDTGGAPAGYGEVLLGMNPALPDWPMIGWLEHVLIQLSDSGAGEARAAALTSLGWIEWCRGRGSFADAFLNQALEEHHGYRLAELMSELVRRGTICGWAGRRDAAWQRFEPDAA